MGTRLTTKCIKLKDKTVKEHQYCLLCQMSRKSVSEDCTGETAWRLLERLLDYNGGDAKSHQIKDAIKKPPKYLKIEDFNKLGKIYWNNKRKIAGSWYIKDIKQNSNATRNMCQ